MPYGIGFTIGNIQKMTYGIGFTIGKESNT